MATGFIIPPNSIERFFNTVLYETRYVLINNWSIIHLFFGISVGVFVASPLRALAIFTSVELFEWGFSGVLFRPDTLKDMATDYAVDFLGWFIARLVVWGHVRWLI